MIGLSSLSMAETPRFTKVNGVVIDSKTTLEWQDDYSDNDGGNIKLANWTDAIDYCEALSLDSKDDWRLPNKKELLSIVDYGTYNPAIISIFEKTTSHYYWSSTTVAANTRYVWAVYFGHGGTGNLHKSDNGYVRCVRAGQ